MNDGAFPWAKRKHFFYKCKEENPTNVRNSTQQRILILTLWQYINSVLEDVNSFSELCRMLAIIDDGGKGFYNIGIPLKVGVLGDTFYLHFMVDGNNYLIEENKTTKNRHYIENVDGIVDEIICDDSDKKETFIKERLADVITNLFPDY